MRIWLYKALGRLIRPLGALRFWLVKPYCPFLQEAGSAFELPLEPIGSKGLVGCYIACGTCGASHFLFRCKGKTHMMPMPPWEEVTSLSEAEEGG